MKKILASFLLLAALLGMPTVGAPALAQNADGTRRRHEHSAVAADRPQPPQPDAYVARDGGTGDAAWPTAGRSSGR